MPLPPTILDLVDPSDLGLPENFTSFRQVQREMADFALYGPNQEGSKRFVLLGCPTGSGKTLGSQAIGKLLGGRYVTLSATKSQQDQIKDKFHVCDVRGKNNYTCGAITVPNRLTGAYEETDCKTGGDYGCRREGTEECPYTSKIAEANEADEVNTNYALWMAVRAINPQALEKFGPISTLICDESHTVPSELARHLDTYLPFNDLIEYGVGKGKLAGSGGGGGVLPWIHSHGAENGKLDGIWYEFLSHAHFNVQTKRTVILEQVKREIAADRPVGYTVSQAEALFHAKHNDDFRRVERLDRELSKLLRHRNDENWIWELGRSGVKFSIIWPWRYAERYLFSGIKKIVLLSGTLRPKLAGLLGIPRAEMHFKEWGRQFPAQNNMVYYVPTVKMHHRMSADDTQAMVDRVDEMIELWRGYKGIIHTASYDRAELLKSMSRFGRQMLLNERGERGNENANWEAEKFKEAQLDPTDVCVLVSPSYTTGWDFPMADDETESWQLIVKIPYHNHGSPIVKARKVDPDYETYDIVQSLVQTCGRRNRNERDVCTTVVLDDAVKRFMGEALRKFAPGYFKVYTRMDLPRPKRRAA